MNKYNFVIEFLRLVLVYVFLGGILIGVSVNSLPKEKACFEAVSDVNQEQLKRIDECGKKLNFTLKDKNTRAGCLMKCAFEMAGAVDSDGQLNVIGMLIFVEQNLPQSVHEWTRYVMVLNCFPKAVYLDAEEFTCRSYAPLGNCVVNTFNLVCNPKPMTDD